MSRRRPILPIALLALFATGAAVYTPDRSRAELEARYLAASSDLRLVDGVRLHVRDEGPRDAPAIVLVHGLGASLHTWDPWVAALSATFRVVRFDVPGHGLTGPDPSGDYSDERSHRLLAALLDSLALDHVTLVGHSMGGRLAWSFAAEQPERVAQLVLIAPDGFASPGFDYDRPADVPAVLGVMRWVLPRPLLRANLAPAYADPSRLADSVARRNHDLMRTPGNRDALLTRLRQTVLTEPTARLARIAAPTLVLWGEDDAMIPVRNADDYARLVPNVTVVRLPGLGHMPFEEAPTDALAPVRAFLDAHVAPRSGLSALPERFGEERVKIERDGNRREFGMPRQ
jgi:pimeloyl-ACP methyl ester carboxylesterase